MKKIICTLLAVCMLFAFCACAPDVTEPTQTDLHTTSPETQDITSPAPTAESENATAETTETASIVESTNETAAPTEETPAETSAPTQPAETKPEETEPEETEHKHSYKEKVIEATCTEKGYTKYTCDCGHSYKDNETPVAKHDYKEKVVAPTETERGYTIFTCKACGHSYKDKYTDATGPEETTPPETSEPVGSVETTPAETTPAETKPSHVHQYASKVTVPTCEDGGYTTFTCSCGDTYIGDKTDPKGHSYKSSVVEPTEKEQGYTLHECGDCGASYKDSYTDPVPPETTVPASTEIKASDVEAAILKYINQFRGSPLTRLSGMSKVAKERSRQIMYAGHFDHITADIKAAHNKYQYGEYKDATLIGLTEADSYYSSNSKEAIAYRGQSVMIENADQMGKEIAEQIKASSGHWSYVGNAKYSFCGIGVSKYNDVWYVCIMVNTVNYG